MTAPHQVRAAQQNPRIIRLLRQGLTRVEVAEACEVSEEHVRRVARSHGGVRALQPTQIYSSLQASRLLGIEDMAMLALIREGHVVAARRVTYTQRGEVSRRQPPTYYRIDRADVRDLLRVRTVWPRITPALIRDDELRRFAEQQRAVAGGCWRTYKEIAALVGVDPRTIADRIQAGWLDGWERTTYGRLIYIWHRTGEAFPPYRGRRY